jgi:hypothetical protein
MEAIKNSGGGPGCPPNQIDRALSEHEAAIAETVQKQALMFGSAKPAKPLGPAPKALPPKPTPARNILFRLDPELNAEVEKLRQSQLGPPSRTAVMRELLRVGLSYYPGLRGK